MLENTLSHLDIVQVLVPDVLACVLKWPPSLVGGHVDDLAPLPVVVALAPELHILALLDLKSRDCCDAKEIELRVQGDRAACAKPPVDFGHLVQLVHLSQRKHAYYTPVEGHNLPTFLVTLFTCGYFTSYF